MSLTRQLSGNTRADGSHFLKIQFMGTLEFPQSLIIDASSEVKDLNSQLLKNNSQFFLHPCPYYIGIKSKNSILKEFVLEFDVVVCDINGKLVPNIPIFLQAFPKSNGLITAMCVAQVEDVSKNEVMSFKLKLDQDMINEAESILLRGFIQLDQCKNFSEYSFSIPPKTPPSTLASPTKKEAPARFYDLVEETIQLSVSSDQEELPVGEQVNLIVKVPFFPCECLFLIQCNAKILQSRSFHMKTNCASIYLTILEEYAPNIWVQVYAVGQTLRLTGSGKEPALDAPKQPATAFGEIELKIACSHHALTLQVNPESSVLEPGGKTQVMVSVKDSATSQSFVSPTEVALVVVDEAVLALSGYKMADPLRTFYALRKKLSGTSHTSLRKQMKIEAWDPILQNIVQLPTKEELDAEEESKKQPEEEEEEEYEETDQETALIDILDTAGQEVFYFNLKI